MRNAFQTTMRGRFAPLAILAYKDADLDSIVSLFNKKVTDTTAEFLGKVGRESLRLPHRFLVCMSKDETLTTRMVRDENKAKVGDKNGKRNLDRRSMPGSGSMPRE